MRCTAKMTHLGAVDSKCREKGFNPPARPISGQAKPPLFRPSALTKI
jgi:hypothetical protein